MGIGTVPINNAIICYVNVVPLETLTFGMASKIFPYSYFYCIV